MPAYACIIQLPTLLSCVISGVHTEIVDNVYLFKGTPMNATNAGEHLILNNTVKNIAVRSKVGCMRACAALGRICAAVEFDELSGNCIAGTAVVLSNEVPALQQKTSVAFYSRHPGTCDVLGFKYIVGSEEVVCLFVSDTKAKRGAAKEICENKDGRLYTMKSIEKYNILERNRNGATSVWVGLKEWETGDPEETFFWDDGVQFMRNDSLWDIFWKTGRPSPTVAPKCVHANNDGGKMKHAETYCSYSKIYACETTPS